MELVKCAALLAEEGNVNYVMVTALLIRVGFMFLEVVRAEHILVVIVMVRAGVPIVVARDVKPVMDVVVKDITIDKVSKTIVQNRLAKAAEHRLQADVLPRTD
jgi:hypothetical protein